MCTERIEHVHKCKTHILNLDTVVLVQLRHWIKITVTNQVIKQ